MNSVVYVIAKAPRPGAVKTRLCPPLRPEQAAQLVGAFLLDTIEIVRAAGCEPRVMCRGTDRAALHGMLGRRVRVCAQPGHGLADALESAFRHGLKHRFSGVAVLGADSPTLPPRVVRAAFHALESGADVGLGPSEDGGYYLLAARAVHPRLFRDMTWSVDSVTRVTLERCQELGLTAHLLPRWYDVDDVASLGRLVAHLDSDPSIPAPATRAALSEILSRGTPSFSMEAAAWPTTLLSPTR